MIRAASTLTTLALAASAYGQGARPAADSLAALQQKADTTAERWSALAKGLEPKIAHMLPCDPAYRAAVEQVTGASEARLSALAAYLGAEVAQAQSDTDAAKRVLAAEASLAGGWNTERAEADQESSAIDGQIADLKESMRKRSALADAETALEELSKMAKERSAKSDQLAGRRDQLNALLGDLVVAYQNRETALENQSARLKVESEKWIVYYTARYSRALMECSIVLSATPKGRP